MMLLFWVALGLVFLIAPYLVMRLVCSALGVRDRAIRIAVFAVIAWAWWQHWQLPPEQTGGGWLARHPVASVGPASSTGSMH